MALGFEGVTLNPFAPVVPDALDAISGKVRCGPEFGDIGDAMETVTDLRRAIRRRKAQLESQVVGAFRETAQLDAAVRKAGAQAEKTTSPAKRDSILSTRSKLAAKRQEAGGKTVALRARLERVRAADKAAVKNPAAAKAILATPIKLSLSAGSAQPKPNAALRRFTQGVPNARPDGIDVPLPMLPGEPHADMMSRLGIPTGANDSRIRTWSMAKGLAEENTIDGLGDAVTTPTWMAGLKATTAAAVGTVQRQTTGVSWATPPGSTTPAAGAGGPQPYSKASPAPAQVAEAVGVAADGGSLADDTAFIAFVKANPDVVARIRATASSTVAVPWNMVADAAEAIAAGGTPSSVRLEAPPAQGQGGGGAGMPDKTPAPEEGGLLKKILIGLGVLAAGGAAYAYAGKKR